MLYYKQTSLKNNAMLKSLLEALTFITYTGLDAFLELLGFLFKSEPLCSKFKSQLLIVWIYAITS